MPLGDVLCRGAQGIQRCLQQLGAANRGELNEDELKERQVRRQACPVEFTRDRRNRTNLVVLWGKTITIRGLAVAAVLIGFQFLYP